MMMMIVHALCISTVLIVLNLQDQQVLGLLHMLSP